MFLKGYFSKKAYSFLKLIRSNPSLIIDKPKWKRNRKVAFLTPPDR